MTLRERPNATASSAKRPQRPARFVLSPAESISRAEVETQVGAIVYDPFDATVVIEDAGNCVGAVALGVDSFVPVVIRAGARFAPVHGFSRGG